MFDARPRFSHIAYLRERAAAFRSLAQRHADADNFEIATKLSQVAAELEQRVDYLEGRGTDGLSDGTG
jgi:hypothetical protein